MSRVIIVKLIGVIPTLASRFCLLAFCVFTFHASSLADIQEESQTFTKCWERPAAPDLTTTLAADSSNVYFIDIDGKLQAVDIVSGARAWSSEPGGEVISNLLVSNGGIYLATRVQANGAEKAGKAVVRSISRQTGITSWSADVPSHTRIWLGAVGEKVFAVSSEGYILALDRDQGNAKWTHDVGNVITSEPFFGERYVSFGTGRNEVIRISGEDSRAVTTAKTKFVPTAVVIGTRAESAIGDERGNLLLMSSDGSREWKWKNGARISSVISFDSEYLAVSHDNFIYKLSRSGDVEWKRRLPGRVIAKPLLLGNTAAVSIVGTGSVYLLNLKNGKITNHIETGEEATAGIAAPPDARSFVIASSSVLKYYSPAQCSAK